MVDKGKSFQIGGFSPQSSFAKVLIPLLDALGWMGTNRELLEALSDQPDTMDREDLLNTMANLRFEGKSLRRFRALTPDRLPCLCLTSDKNVLCLVKEEKGSLLYFNALSGNYEKSNSLKKIREYLYFKSLDKERLSLLKPQKKWFSKLLLRFRKELSTLGLLSLFLTFISFLTPLVIILIYSQIEGSDNRKILLQLGGGVLLFIVATTGIKYLRSRLQNHFSVRLGNLVNREILRRLLYLPPRYTEKTSLESQFSRIRDFESIKNFFAGRAFTSLMDAPLSLLMLAGLSVLAGPIAWIPFITIILFLVGGIFSFRIYKRLNEERSQLVTRKSHLKAEMLDMVGESGSRWGVDRWIDRIQKVSRDSNESSAISDRYLNAVDQVGSLLVKISLVLTISWGVFRVMNGLMDRGTLFAAFLICSRILSPMYSGLTVFSQISKLTGSIEQLNRFMNIPLESRPETLITLNKHLSGVITFRKVYLKYGGEFSPVLRNINFTLPERSILFITGHGGSGKSSILKLIMAQYSPYSGAVLLDGMNLQQIDPLRLRKSISYVPSSGTLFMGTIRKNLYIAKPDATEKELQTVLEEWDLWDEISILKNGLDSPVEDFCSVNRSGDATKRLHLAMHSLKLNPILVIDDLERDLPEERIPWLKEKLVEIRKEASVVITSSHSKLLEMADQILWIDNGQMKKLGPPAEVLPEYQKNQTGIKER